MTLTVSSFKLPQLAAIFHLQRFLRGLVRLASRLNLGELCELFLVSSLSGRVSGLRAGITQS